MTIIRDFLYGISQLRDDFAPYLQGWSDNGRYQLSLIGAIVALFFDQARRDRSAIGLTDFRFDGARLISGRVNDYFLGVSLGKIINIGIISADYDRHDDLCICFVGNISFSGPEEPARSLFLQFREFAKRQKFESIITEAKERLKKEKPDRLDGETKCFFDI